MTLDIHLRHDKMSNQLHGSNPKSHGGGPDEDWKRSAGSLPLLQDDDYFYYHSPHPDGDETVDRHDDDGGEPVDHVGALIGPSFSTTSRTTAPVEKQEERDMKSSLLSHQPSEITCDEWSIDLTELSQGGLEIEEGCENEISVEDFVGLKVRVAELETQLQFQRRNDSLERKVQDLQNRRLSLECENVGLKQLLQETAGKQDAARRFQTLLLDEIGDIRRENEALRAENRRLRHRRQGCLQESLSLSGRSDASDAEGSHREGEEGGLDSSMGVGYLPFPRRPRRATTGAETGQASKGPSLLAALRPRIADNSNPRCGPPGQLESSDGSRATRATADATLPSSDASRLYETWGNASQTSTDATEQYLQSSARLLTKIEDARKRDRLRRSKSEKCLSTAVDAPSSPIPKTKRNKYFNLPRIGSSFSLASLVGSGEGEKEFDAKDELWDASGRDGGEEDGNKAPRHFRASAQF